MATATATQSPPSQAQIRAQARPEIERQRNDAQQQANQKIDREAVDAVRETRDALRAIEEGRADEALRAIERATGKIDVLTSRDPRTALPAVDADVIVVDTAPLDIRPIRDIAEAVDDAIADRDFPLARTLLAMLVSEIRVRTVHLPLGSYPVALREAARFLDEGRNDEAAGLLRVALNSLVVIERVIPLPMLVARVAVNSAEAMRDSDRETALGLLRVARTELARAMELGYTGKDEEYSNLNKAIDEVEKQLKGNENSTSAFGRLKERLSAFFRRLTEDEKRSADRGGNGNRPGGDGRAGASRAVNPQQQQQQSGTGAR